MFCFQIADAAAHIPDDIVPLPIFPQSFRQQFIGFVHDVQRRVKRAFEIAFIDRNQAVPPFQQIVAVFLFGRAVVNRPKLLVSFLVADFVQAPFQQKRRHIVFVDQLGRQFLMRGRFSVAHNVGVKQQGIFVGVQAADFPSDHVHPPVEHLFQIVRRDLRADDFAVFDGVFYGFYKFVALRFDLKSDKARPDVCRYGFQSFPRVLAGGFPPVDFICFVFFNQKRQDFGGFHNRRLDTVHHAKKRRNFLAFFMGGEHIAQQLREHFIDGCLTAFFGFKPNFLCLYVDQIFSCSFQSENINVNVFDIFFAADVLQSFK